MDLRTRMMLLPTIITQEGDCPFTINLSFLAEGSLESPLDLIKKLDSLTVMDSIKVSSTKVFSCLTIDNDDFISSDISPQNKPLPQQYAVQCSRLRRTTIQRMMAKKRFESNGFNVLRNVFDPAILSETKDFINRFTKRKLIPYYDISADEFDGFNLEEHHIVRLPRIGNGKHNVHFDPEFSPEHEALSRLIEQSVVLPYLSFYMGKRCSLRETGMSVTRPSFDQQNSST